MDSEIRNELFTLLREVNDAETMKDSQLRDCIDELEEALQAAAVEPGLDAVEWEEIHISKSDDGTGVVIEVEGVPDSRGRRVVIATGATLGEAIAAAVRQATGAGGRD